MKCKWLILPALLTLAGLPARAAAQMYQDVTLAITNTNSGGLSNGPTYATVAVQTNSTTMTVNGIAPATAVLSYTINTSTAADYSEGHIKGDNVNGTIKTGDFSGSTIISIPEPSSFMLVCAGAGVGLMGWVFRRRRPDGQLQSPAENAQE